MRVRHLGPIGLRGTNGLQAISGPSFYPIQMSQAQFDELFWRVKKMDFTFSVQSTGMSSVVTDTISLTRQNIDVTRRELDLMKLGLDSDTEDNPSLLLHNGYFAGSPSVGSNHTSNAFVAVCHRHRTTQLSGFPIDTWAETPVAAERYYFENRIWQPYFAAWVITTFDFGTEGQNVVASFPLGGVTTLPDGTLSDDMSFALTGVAEIGSVTTGAIGIAYTEWYPNEKAAGGDPVWLFSDGSQLLQNYQVPL